MYHPLEVNVLHKHIEILKKQLEENLEDVNWEDDLCQESGSGETTTSAVSHACYRALAVRSLCSCASRRCLTVLSCALCNGDAGVRPISPCCVRWRRC